MYQAILRIASRALGWRKPILVSGAGSVKKVAGLIKEKGISRVLLVTDKGLTSIHLPDGLIESLKSEGISCFVYDGTQPNPTFENIEQAEKLYSENKCQAFVAFGGGSPMDCAKAAAARIVRPNKPIKSMRGLFKVGKKLPPFFAVPTTAGTGSETTIAAVVTDSTTHEKYAINDLHLIPHYAVLDPELTLGLPPHITSTTGMDALT
ncbi:MAG: iron-containing alcohol dehydrogenase, partial [Clostridiales bacterium]|nr:iron-containing alcohol dehydrogenase [Clostridiales bacterium]